jgi:REP element-mobilizing transposase RayT
LILYFFKGGDILGRPTRADHKGGIYHVIARGNNKEFIFLDEKDKGYFISVLKKDTITMGCKVYGYVLMSNHYHIIMQTLDKKLQEIMHKINNKYSKYFNLKYERVGHVFQGRYKSSIVQDESYMFHVLRYVHQNPVAAGLCKAVQDYKWSSDRYYRRGLDGFVDTSLVIEMLSNDLIEARKKYTAFIDAGNDECFEDVDIVGDEAFKILYESKKKQTQERKTLDEILKDTGLSTEEFNLIKMRSKKRSLTIFKMKYIEAAINNNYTLKEIASNINVSDSAVKEILERYRNCIKS